MKVSKIVWLILLIATLPSCSTPGDDEPDRSNHETGSNLGSIEFRLRLPDYSGLDSITYTIESLAGVVWSGQIPVGDEPTVAFQIGSLPAMSSYQLELEATTSDGIPCSALPTVFDVLSGQTVGIQTTLLCGLGVVASDNGNAHVEVAVEQQPNCARVAGLTAVPLRVRVGETIALQATASFVTWLAWTGSGGTFVEYVEPFAQSTAIIGHLFFPGGRVSSACQISSAERSAITAERTCSIAEFTALAQRQEPQISASIVAADYDGCGCVGWSARSCCLERS